MLHIFSHFPIPTSVAMWFEKMQGDFLLGGGCLGDELSTILSIGKKICKPGGLGIRSLVSLS